MSHQNFHAARALRSHLLIGLSVLGVSFASAVLIQYALAQSDSPALKPPFHLKLAQQIAPASIILPNPALGGSILISETFDSSYAPTTTLSATGWHQVTGTLATSSYTWGRVNSGPHPDSAWAAATSLNGDPILDPAADFYTKGMESLLIYGPIDLTNYRAAVMTASYFLDSAPSDLFGVAASTDGANFDALSADSSQDPALSVTHTAIYDLHAYKQKPAVWIAYYFVSNSDDSVGRGAFVDAMVIRALPMVKIYLPIIGGAPAAPAQTFLYSYTFGSGLNTNSDFLTWGGTYDESCGTDCTRWGQSVNTAGHPNGAMNLYLTTFNDIAAASPNVTATTNYTYSADIYVVQGKGSARFGLIFGASLSTFDRDGNGDPTFDPNRNFYKFDLQFLDTDNTVVSDYRLSKCQNSFVGCTVIVQKTPVPGGLVGNSGTWNNVTIIRNGNNITGKVNGTQLFSITDSTFTGGRKFGIFVHSKDLNSAGNPLKIRFDNVSIMALP